MTRANTAVDFWTKVDLRGANDCWPWLASRNAKGYGTAYFQGDKWQAHRLAYVLRNGLIRDPRLFVCHTCDNPPCCNPAHLFLGSTAENIQDAFSKGRIVRSGESNGRAKVSRDDVVAIREMYESGEWSQPAIAAEFGISNQQVSNIVRRQAWVEAI